MRPVHHALLALGLLLPGALGAQATAPAPSAKSIPSDLDRLIRGEQVAGVSPTDSIWAGPRTIAAGTTVRGPVIARGPIDVAGTVTGAVVSLAGNVTVRAGGSVTGDVLAVGGRVIADSGRVEGEMRSLSTLPTLGAAALPVAPPSASRTTLDAVRIVSGVFAMLLVIALGVLLFAGRNLDEVVGTLEHRFGRAFMVGVLGQVLILPVLVVLIAALAVSVIGILLIPFAIVAYAVAVAGIVTLGFLAIARLIGGAFWHPEGASPRARTLGALALGIGVFFALWMIASLLGWAPLAASMMRAAALAATWAALTLGLGAAILSRAGTHRRLANGQRPIELATWQTPTPISGVIAARRPVTASGDAR